jgi:hypothetical protein
VGLQLVQLDLAFQPWPISSSMLSLLRSEQLLLKGQVFPLQLLDCCSLLLLLSCHDVGIVRVGVAFGVLSGLLVALPAQLSLPVFLQSNTLPQNPRR